VSSAPFVPSPPLSLPVPVPLPRWHGLLPLQYVAAVSPLTPAGRRRCTAATARLYATGNGGPGRCLLSSITLLYGRGGGKVVYQTRRLVSRVSRRSGNSGATVVVW